MSGVGVPFMRLATPPTGYPGSATDKVKLLYNNPVVVLKCVVHGKYMLYIHSGGCRISRRGGRGLPRQLRFANFVCQNERIWTLGGRAPGTPPLDPPMIQVSFLQE